jgi:small subunit ribosomal protein S16
MLTIRMRRMGSTKRPMFRIVVAEASAPRDGRFIEVLGHYHPRATPAKVEIDRERLAYWLGKGARPSETVRALVARLPAPEREPAPEASPRT